MIATGVFQKSIAAFLAPVRHLLDDAGVSEIMINGHEEIWVERKGLISKTDDRFPSEAGLIAALTNISQFAGRPLNQQHPILEAHLPDGSRIEAVLPPVSKQGPAVSIRKFSKTMLTIKKLVDLDSLSAKAAVFLARAVASKKNIVVSGGTGSGKTSLLGALSAFFSLGERIVVLEDTHEIQIQRPHVVYLESKSADEKGRGRITIRDLLRATLRLRPDRIIVGEVRGQEALDLIQSMISGHAGSMTTVHANHPIDALRRIETMGLMSDTELPLSALRSQISSAVDIVVQAERTRDGKRQIGEISAIHNLIDNDYSLTKLFARDSHQNLVALKKPVRPGGTK